MQKIYSCLTYLLLCIIHFRNSDFIKRKSSRSCRDSPYSSDLTGMEKHINPFSELTYLYQLQVSLQALEYAEIFIFYYIICCVNKFAIVCHTALGHHLWYTLSWMRSLKKRCEVSYLLLRTDGAAIVTSSSADGFRYIMDL